jgi:hypothetical protein
MSILIQINDLVREATAEEIEEIELRASEATAQAEALAEKQVAKTALLERLGITEEEAALLLG